MTLVTRYINNWTKLFSNSNWMLGTVGSAGTHDTEVRFGSSERAPQSRKQYCTTKVTEIIPWPSSSGLSNLVKGWRRFSVEVSSTYRMLHTKMFTPSCCSRFLVPGESSTFELSLWFRRSVPAAPPHNRHPWLNLVLRLQSPYQNGVPSECLIFTLPQDAQIGLVFFLSLGVLLRIATTSN